MKGKAQNTHSHIRKSRSHTTRTHTPHTHTHMCTHVNCGREVHLRRCASELVHVGLLYMGRWSRGRAGRKQTSWTSCASASPGGTACKKPSVPWIQFREIVSTCKLMNQECLCFTCAIEKQNIQVQSITIQFHKYGVSHLASTSTKSLTLKCRKRFNL